MIKVYGKRLAIWVLKTFIGMVLGVVLGALLEKIEIYLIRRKINKDVKRIRKWYSNAGEVVVGKNSEELFTLYLRTEKKPKVNRDRFVMILEGV